MAALKFANNLMLLSKDFFLAGLLVAGAAQCLMFSSLALRITYEIYQPPTKDGSLSKAIKDACDSVKRPKNTMPPLDLP